MFVIRICFIISFILMIPYHVFGQSTISFDKNGRWACPFKASDFPDDICQSGNPGYYEATPMAGVFFYQGDWVTNACGSLSMRSCIRAGDNHEAGEGDRAFRFAIGDGTNRNTSPLVIRIPLSPEVWMRFYIKWEEGWRWNSLTYQKVLLFHTYLDRMYQAMPFQWGNRIELTPKINNSTEWVKGENHGWDFMYGTNKAPGESRAYSDGSWHSVEVYAKMNSAIGVFDGAAAIWVDGSLAVKETAVRWDAGYETDLDGFQRLTLALNQSEPGNASGPLNRACAYTYYDDIVIYNQTPPNVDAHGNPFIGPLPPAPPGQLNITVEPLN
jgi:hypothetical protein